MINNFDKGGLSMNRNLLLGLSLLLIGGLCGFFISQTVNVSTRSSEVYTGYLVCQSCAGANQAMAGEGVNLLEHPEKHTVSCLRMYTCVTSGFGIFIKNSDGNYSYYKFDKKGSDLAYKRIVAVTKKADNLLVDVTGRMSGNTILVNSISEK